MVISPKKLEYKAVSGGVKECNAEKYRFKYKTKTKQLLRKNETNVLRTISKKT